MAEGESTLNIAVFPSVNMKVNIFPNLQAIRQGRIPEWAAIRGELDRMIITYEAAIEGQDRLISELRKQVAELDPTKRGEP